MAIRLVVSPRECSFLSQPEQTISFFKEAKSIYERNAGVRYDLSNVTYFCETAAAVLMAFIKDRKINRGMASSLIWPDDLKVRERLVSYGLQKRISQNDISEVEVGLEPIKVSESKVANQVAKDLVDITSKILFGDNRKIKELYAILIEMMANTNNHAARGIYNIPRIIKETTVVDGADGETVCWWLFTFYDHESHSVKYVFLDFGVGMFESLPVKQFIQRVPAPVISVEYRIQLRAIELAHVWENLVAGKIRSSTGDPSRGRGIPLIADCADSHMFRRFEIIANDAYVDLKKRVTASMNEHFGGTLFYFELMGGEV